MATEKMADKRRVNINSMIGKSSGVLLIITFSNNRVLTPNKSMTTRVAKITKACFGKLKKSVVKLVKKIGKMINNRQKTATEAFSR